MNTNGQFHNQAFLNLETFRKDGTGVRTPVWFVEDGKLFYVRTLADSWKVKRIRNNSRVRVVSCKAQGEPLGEWVTAAARQIDDRTGALLAWAGIADSYSFRQDYSDLGNWIIDLEELLGGKPSFPSDRIEARVMTALAKSLWIACPEHAKHLFKISMG